MITLESIPLRASQTIVRQDMNGVLLFQTATDQMYFVGPEAGVVFGLCDGTRAVRDIVDVLVSQNESWNHIEAERSVVEIIDKLLSRRLIEIWK